MATVTYIKETKQHVSAMKAVMRYCQREDKTTDPKTGVRYVTGLNCNGANWEPEREYFYLHVRGAHQRRERNPGRVRSTAGEKKPAYVDHDLSLGGAVGAGIRAVSALGRLTADDDSGDPEEQKRKYEAQQAADNVGAVLGLAIGAMEAFTRNNQSLTRPQDEDRQIEEEEEFNEFLAGLDEEYEYEEQQQMM